jgi:hypothetical protein
MYVLMTKQYPRDTNVPSDAPRLIDADPLKVLEAARAILNCEKESEEWTWVSHIFIYFLEPGRQYTIWNASLHEHVNKDGVLTIAYVAWWDSHNKPHEGFHGDFASKCRAVGEPE